LAWDNVDFSQKKLRSVGRITHPSTFQNIGDKGKNKRKPLRERYTSTSDSGQLPLENDFDVTLIPNIGCNTSKESSINLNDVVTNKNNVLMN